MFPEGRSLLGEVTRVNEVRVNKRWLTEESWPREYMCVKAVRLDDLRSIVVWNQQQE